MLAVQKPPTFFPSTPAYMHRPTHARHPSAPVLIRPTHTPGLLSISKPVQQPAKQQHPQHHSRAPKQSAKGKNQRSHQSAPAHTPSVEDDKKSPQPKPRFPPLTDKAAKSGTSAPSSEKPPRGRQPGKSAAKDKADRSASQQRTYAHARRLPHQPSPTRIHQQNESSTRPPVNPFRAQSFVHREQDSNLFDPFVVNSTSDNESTGSIPPAESKGGDKPFSFRAPPQLNSRPSGKLARRRQTGQTENSPSKNLVPGRKGHKHPVTSVSQSGPSLAFTSPSPALPRRNSADVSAVAWDDFPICDDTTLASTATTPIRDSASVPPKYSNITWQQSLIDDGPRTAPLSTALNFSFPAVAQYSTPSSANRRRHRRVPSEGVFAMSMDEDSAESSDELKEALKKHLFARQASRAARRTPTPTSDSAPASFYAGSVFQNSPSPDELPVPAFRA
ncbi:hypothetical protein BC835DRAFT_295078 [Cytidiella melzeri]|nr:hypothetical protein BC835DRAFT_295078 [Cytidiella melzeri]